MLGYTPEDEGSQIFTLLVVVHEPADFAWYVLATSPHLLGCYKLLFPPYTLPINHYSHFSFRKPS